MPAAHQVPHLSAVRRSNALPAAACGHLYPTLQHNRKEPRQRVANRDMGKYFLRDAEVDEPDAACAWFAYAGDQGIDVPRAISIWEDAATEDGTDSRRVVSRAGIRIEPGGV